MASVPLDPMDPRPPYRQIADELRRAIHAGEILPGGRLPSERKLVDRYGTAPQTVRQALNVLKAEGLVLGRQGRGVFVRERPPLAYQLQATRRFVIQAGEQGRSAEVRLLAVEPSAIPTPEIVRRLNLEPSAGPRVVIRQYLLLLDDEPVQLAASYFPVELAEGTVLAAPDDVTPGEIDRDLKDRFGLDPARFHDEVTVRMPVPEETRLLRLLPGTPVADVLRTYFDGGGTPFEVARYVISGDRHVLVYEGRLTKERDRRG